MCSRNGMPVASCARPLPSSSTRTRIWVSFVLRTTSAVRISERFFQRIEQNTVFLWRADRNAQRLRDPGMQITDQHALVAQRLVGMVGVSHTHEKEVGARREHLHAV